MFDTDHQQLVIFAGYTDRHYLNDVFALRLAGIGGNPVDPEEPAATGSAASISPHPPVVMGLQPNPGRGMVDLTLAVADRRPARVVVYDVGGRALRDLFRGDLNPGEHHITWDGRDSSGEAVPAGTYFVRVDTPAGSRTLRAVLLR